MARNKTVRNTVQLIKTCGPCSAILGAKIYVKVKIAVSLQILAIRDIRSEDATTPRRLQIVVRNRYAFARLKTKYDTKYLMPLQPWAILSVTSGRWNKYPSLKKDMPNMETTHDAPVKVIALVQSARAL